MVDLPAGGDGRRRQRKKGGFRTKKEAEAALAALLTDVQKGTVLGPSRQTLAAYLDDWLASAAPSLRATTVQGYETVVMRFDGVFERTLPKNIEQAAFMEWLPNQVYKRTSEVLVGKEFWRRLFDHESPDRPNLDLLLSRRDLPLEEWIDTDDPVLVERAAALFDRIEEQLAERELPPPPAEAAEAR